MSAPILPVDFDRDTGEFFRAAREDRLIYRACNSCGCGMSMPAQFCGRCGSRDTSWREATGRGTLYTWTSVVHAVHPGYPAPYTIVVIALDEAPEVRFVGALPGVPQLTAGQPMQVEWNEVSKSRGLPQWRPSV